MAPADRAAQWIALAPAPPVEQLHELASLLADSCANSEQKINDGKEQELCALIFNMVPFRDLAMMVNCLRRGAGQLRRASWKAFCTAHKQKSPDPFESEPLMLLQFLCWTITHAPEHFLTSKGKTPIMKAATCLSKHVMAASLAAPLEVDSDNSGDHDHTPPAPKSDNEESAKRLQFCSPTPWGLSVLSAVTKKRWADMSDDDDDMM